MKALPKNKVLLVVGGIILLLVVLIATGALKFNFEVSKSPGGKAATGGAPAQQSKLAKRIEFGGTADKPKFSIAAPVGWARGEEPSVDLAMGSVTPEKLPEGGTFTVNIVATIGPHPYSVGGISDYRSSWKDYMLGQYPSMEFVAGDQADVGNMEAYVFEMKQTRGDGLVVHQLQYLFYINSKYGLGVTGSAPDSVWDKYKEAIKASLESLELINPGTSGEETGSVTLTTEKQEEVSYANASLGISVMYPGTWGKVEKLQDGLISFNASSQTQTVNIVANKLPKTYTLSEYTKLSLDQMTKQGMDVIEQKEATLSGTPAHKAVYTSGDGIKFMSVWTVKGGKEYVFSYAGKTKSDYDAGFAAAQKMLESFEIK